MTKVSLLSSGHGLVLRDVRLCETWQLTLLYLPTLYRSDLLIDPSSEYWQWSLHPLPIIDEDHPASQTEAGRPLKDCYPLHPNRALVPELCTSSVLFLKPKLRARAELRKIRGPRFSGFVKCSKGSEGVRCLRESWKSCSEHGGLTLLGWRRLQMGLEGRRVSRMGPDLNIKSIEVNLIAVRKSGACTNSRSSLSS